MATDLSSSAWRAAVGPVWAEVDLDAIADNVRTVLGVLRPGCRLLAVVKANAYGHGAAEVARVAVAAGAAGLGVSTVAEGLALRVAGVDAPVLVFTPARPEDVPAAVSAGLTLTVVSAAQASGLGEAAARRGASVSVHVKCDTGMGRYGFTPEELAAAAPELAGLGDALHWDGIYTHFPRGADPGVTRAQLQLFLGAVAAARQGGLVCAVRHAAASAAVVAVPEAQLDMVRVGNLLYGDRPVAGAPQVRRAFALRVRAAQVRDLPAGATVGYGSERRLRRATRVAVYPVGFADGLDIAPAGPYRRPAVLLRALARALLGAFGLSGGLGAAAGELRLDGRPLPVLGRVAMQQVVVDAGGVPPELLEQPARVHVRPLLVGAHVARVYLRDGVPVRAATAAGALAASPAAED